MRIRFALPASGNKQRTLKLDRIGRSELIGAHGTHQSEVARQKRRLLRQVRNLEAARAPAQDCCTFSALDWEAASREK